MPVHENPTDFRLLARRSTRASLGVLLLTVVHHVYGAWLYATPWRLHVVGIAAVAGALILGASSLAVSHRGVALAVFTLLTAAIPVGWIGAFEGLYSHVFKDLLFLAGTRPQVMGRLFPASVYSLPDDLLFELTGVLQVPLAVWVVREHWLLLREGLRARSFTPGWESGR
ncbi:hypothetical protein F0U60_43070 [Archangium minus]|uniref:Lycopene cyclase domain-containing protein n=1 Tax=Archangium minus TaxID=83450 RepID=A0ABY9X419_9BACT|nr:hypothetical protein F0U60_43070 [Archangium minus]